MKRHEVINDFNLSRYSETSVTFFLPLKILAFFALGCVDTCLLQDGNFWLSVKVVRAFTFSQFKVRNLFLAMNVSILFPLNSQCRSRSRDSINLNFTMLCIKNIKHFKNCILFFFFWVIWCYLYANPKLRKKTKHCTAPIFLDIFTLKLMMKIFQCTYPAKWNCIK